MFLFKNRTTLITMGMSLKRKKHGLIEPGFWISRLGYMKMGKLKKKYSHLIPD